MLNSKGNTPLSKDMFIICVKGTIKLECVALITREEIVSQPALLSFKDFITDWTSSSTTGVITILSRTRFSMYVVGDLLSCGMSFAKVGPIYKILIEASCNFHFICSCFSIYHKSWTWAGIVPFVYNIFWNTPRFFQIAFIFIQKCLIMFLFCFKKQFIEFIPLLFILQFMFNISCIFVPLI